MEDYFKMKKIIPHVTKFFNITFALYTCVSFGMMLLNIAFVTGEAPKWNGVALLFAHMLLFSAICGLAITLTSIPKKLSGALAHVIRFVCCYGAFYLCFFALVKNTAEPINVVVLSTAFVIIYAVVAVACAVFRALLCKKAAAADEYENVYSDNK